MYAAYYSKKTTQQNNEITGLIQKAEKGNATARNELRKMAERDNVNAQVALGDYYYNSQNYNEAIKWYRKAITKGNAEAAYRLGLCYEKGHGVQKDNKTALLWYNTAAKQGNQEAQKRLNEINKQSQQNTNVSASYAAMYNSEKPTQQNNEITDLIHKAQAGDVDAQYDLGNRYLNGDGVEQDVEKASYWFQQNTANTKKTQNNNASASYAAMYNNEKPTQQNNEIADLIQKAQAGDAEAQCKLGVWYEKGQNYYEAVFWYKEAAEQGHADAQNNLGECYFYGHGVNENYNEAVKWFRKAAEQDNGKAQRYLGNCYVLGAGVPQDYEKAEMWHDKAKENYHEFDEDLLLEMEKAFKS